ncbi:MAG: hypothetical protein ACP5OU_09750 [Methanothrix sp.]
MMMAITQEIKIDPAWTQAALQHGDRPQPTILGSLPARAAHSRLASPHARAGGRGPCRGSCSHFLCQVEVGADTLAKRPAERRQACGTGRLSEEGGWVEGSDCLEQVIGIPFRVSRIN